MATQMRIASGSNVIPVDQLATLLQTLPSLPRPMLALLTERLIEHLDEIDGDWDLEDDDPAGGNPDDEWRPEGITLPFPKYGNDQSAGPINKADAQRAYMRGMMEQRP